MTYKELGQLVQQKRKTLGITQSELGSLANVSFRTIQNIELGKKTHISTLREILKLLNTDLKVLIIENGKTDELEF